MARSGGRSVPQAAHLATAAVVDLRTSDAAVVAGPTAGPASTAQRIAQRIADAAVLADGGPRWLGRAVTADGTVDVADLGDTFVSGRAGIAWFLAGAAESSRDQKLARIARGAASGALAAASRLPGFAARAEVARACLGVADACNDTDLGRDALDALDAVLRRTASSSIRDLGPDGLDTMARVLLAGLRRCVTPNGAQACGALAGALAAACGERRARPLAGRTGPGGGPAPCGLPHGTAGSGLALAAAAVALGEAAGAAVPEAALEALRSERAWLDRARVAVATHPSLRCHGAAAVARTRLATMGVLARRRPHPTAPALAALADECAADAAAALHLVRVGATDMARRLSWNGHDAFDLSLCHGAAGVAETLLIAAEVTGHIGYLCVARELAAEIARRAAVAPVPGGLPDRSETLGLALGIAGTGATLLRAAGGRLPSPALLGVPR
jgi:hypothetical protein